MTLSTVRVVARVVAVPEYTEAVKLILLELVELTRKEVGCIQYDLLQNQLDPSDFTFVEEWSSHSALDQHLGSEHLQTAAAKLTGLLVSVPDIRRYQCLK